MSSKNETLIKELEQTLSWIKDDIEKVRPIYEKVAQEQDRYTESELNVVMKPYTELIVKMNQLINTIAILKKLPAGADADEIEREIQKNYRTRSAAGDDLVRKYPDTLIIPSQRKYQYTMSLYQEGSAHLIPVPLKMENGKLSIDSAAIEEKTTAELQNLITKELVTDVDITTLQALYSLILYQFQLAHFLDMKDVYRVYLPDLAEYLGYDRSAMNSDDQRRAIINKIKSFHNVTGVITIDRGEDKRPYKNYYQVLNFEDYEEKTNTIRFSSPYMNNVIKIILENSIRKDKNGQPKLTAAGQPTFKPTHSYLIDSSISKEKNKAAVENVYIIVSLIEQAGKDALPHISAENLIDRSQNFKVQFQNSKNQTVVLKRVFKRTWELLRDKTRLAEKYSDIQLPDPDDPNNIPTKKTYEKMSFTFKHDGVKKEWTEK